jgi:hypothetical protein
MKHTILIQPTNGSYTAMNALLYSASLHVRLQNTDMGLIS